MGKLHEINQRTEKIPLEMFYVHELMGLVDIRSDYVNWYLTNHVRYFLVTLCFQKVYFKKFVVFKKSIN